MTFILISSSGTMAMAVNSAIAAIATKTVALMLATAAFGATFVGMQAFEWTKLIMEGVRPWGNPWGAPSSARAFFMITGFHGTHVTIGVIFLIIIARKVWRGDFEREARASSPAGRGDYEIVEITGLYWHFVDLCGCSSLPSSIFGEVTMAQAAVAHVEGQQHPIKLYLLVWGWLFVLSTCSYLVDYFGLHGYLRWSLILLFMILKAGLIVAVFMHMAWERLALTYSIFLHPSVGVSVCGHHGVRIELHAFHSDHIFWGRGPRLGPVFSWGIAKGNCT